jgi:twinkle protein
MTDQTESTMVSKGPCQKCGSSDGNVLFSDGHKYCFVCPESDAFTPPTISQSNAEPAVQMPHNTQWESGALTDRGISAKTAKKFEVQHEKSGDKITKHRYNYYIGDRKESTKVRLCDTKEFPSTGNITKCGLFGQQLFPKGGKTITVTEGECDAMAVYEMNGGYPVVSLKTSSSARKQAQAQMEYLNSYENIVLAFDQDDAGRKAAGEFAAIFEPKKVKVMKLDEGTDPNDYLRSGRIKDFVAAFWRAEPYTPAGIINLADIGDELYDESQQDTYTYPWECLNDMLYGLRTGELITVTAGSGIGKSTLTREIAHHLIKTADVNIGILALEENKRKTCFHIMGVEANKRLHIKDVRLEQTKEDLKKWELATIGTRKVFAFDHFGSTGNDEILDRVRYMVKALDCKIIILDHLSIVVSGQEGGDERKSIDLLMTKLRSIVEETGCGLILVSHLKRSDGKTAEEGGRVTLGDLRGSQSIAQLSDIVLAGERDAQNDDPNESNKVVLRILKSRDIGDLGVAGTLRYDKMTGRLHEVPDDPEDLSNEFETIEDQYPTLTEKVA